MYRVATDLENLELSGNLEMVWKTWKSQGICYVVRENNFLTKKFFSGKIMFKTTVIEGLLQRCVTVIHKSYYLSDICVHYI